MLEVVLIRFAFGLLIASNPYNCELVAEIGVTRGGDGGCTICGGAGFFIGWLTLATAYFEEHSCKHNPTEPVSPRVHRRSPSTGVAVSRGAPSAKPVAAADGRRLVGFWEVLGSPRRTVLSLVVGRQLERQHEMCPMKTYIALFRGINVGGKNALPMKELVGLLEDLGARKVKTYIQSGNAVFVAKDKDAPRLSNMIKAEIKKRRGFEPYVLLLGLEDFARAIEQNPFPEAESDPQALHAGFLGAAPGRPDMKKLESLKSDSERFRLIDSVFYLHAPEGIGRSKLAANAERLLGVPMTDRNWRTVRAIWSMAQELK
jgi:uncharacterized protein (DUF1697 family)